MRTVPKAVPLVRYSGPFLKWTREELKALHPRDDVDGLYVSRKEGGRGIASIEDSVDASIQRLERLHRKTRTRTNYNHQSRYVQHDRRWNDNN